MLSPRPVPAIAEGYFLSPRPSIPQAVWINAPYCGQTSRRHLLPPGAENPLRTGTTPEWHSQQVKDARNSYTPGYQEIPIHKTTDTLVFNLPSQGSSSTTPGRRKTRVPAGAARAVDAAGGEKKCEVKCNAMHRGCAVQMRDRAGLTIGFRGDLSPAGSLFPDQVPHTGRGMPLTQRCVEPRATALAQ